MCKLPAGTKNQEYINILLMHINWGNTPHGCHETPYNNSASSSRCIIIDIMNLHNGIIARNYSYLDSFYPFFIINKFLLVTNVKLELSR